MKRPPVRLALAVSAIAVVGLGLGAPSASATTKAAAGGGGAKGTCSQLTKAEIQPLLTNQISKITVKPETSQLYNFQKTHIGQQCIVAAGSGDSEAMTIVVISGPFAAKAYAADVQSLGPRPTSVPGVGSKAIRERVDSDGAEGTPELSSIKGSTYCAVTPQADNIPGVGAREEAAGDTSDIGNTAYGEIAAAIGTLCNRVYGSGNTTPDLSGLEAPAPPSSTTTTFGP